MIETRKEEVVVKCSDKKSFEIVNQKLKQAAYDVKEPRKLYQRVRVVVYEADENGINDETNEKILDSIISKNDLDMNNSTFHARIVNKFPNTQKNFTVLLLELDCQTREKIMNEKLGRIAVGGGVYRVYEVDVAQICYKCNGYRHNSDKCKQTNDVCGFCSKDHKSKDCPDKINLKNFCCTNCNSFNIKRKLENSDQKLDTNHKAHSSVCHMYLKEIEAQKCRFD
jgi:hypothetical protein